MMLILLLVAATVSGETATSSKAVPAATVAGVVRNVVTYARCNGGDDTAGLEAALHALRSGDTLVIPAGTTCRHSGVLSVTTPGVHITGPGTLLATNEQNSSIWIDADDVLVDGELTLKISSVSRRWEAYEQAKLRLVSGRTGIIVRDVTIDGSAAAGVYIGGAVHFLLDHVQVLNTRADGIHMTGGAHDGVVQNATVRNSGDDGIAIVSYQSNPEICHDIQVIGPTVQSTAWGRGISVIGGKNVTYTDLLVDSTNAAAIYIAQESSFKTSSVNNVKILGGRLTNSNTNMNVDQGAVLVYASQAGYSVTDVTMSDIAITDTRATTSRTVGVLATGGSSIARVALNRFTIVGDTAMSFASNVPGSYSTTGWSVNGVAVADRR